VERLAVGALAALTAIAYGTHSVLRHLHFGSNGYDLGIFDQAIWHYSNLETPTSTVRAVSNLLGDHFHPILITLAPLYKVWADPIVLLIAQAVLIAVSVFPVHRFARRRLEAVPALLIAAAYVSFWGIHSAVHFDFHEVAFGPLLIALAIDYADRGRWWRFTIAALLMLLVKENMSVLLVFFGLWLLLRREWLRGTATAFAGVIAYLLVTRTVIPALNDIEQFHYWSYFQLGADLSDALVTIVTEPWVAVEVFVTPFVKVTTTLLMFAAFAGLSLLSPIVVLAVPLISERMFSVVAGLWDTKGHYALTIAPVLAMSAADGLARLGRRLPAARRRPVILGLAGTALAASLTIALHFPLTNLFDSDLYASSSRDRLTRKVLDRIPEHASVTAQNHFQPHLTHRDVIYTFRPNMPDTEYLVIDFNGGSAYPARDPLELLRMVEARRDRYRYVYALGSVVLLRREVAPPGRMRRAGRRAEGARPLERGLAGLLGLAPGAVACDRTGDHPRAWDCAAGPAARAVAFAITYHVPSGCWLGVPTGDGAPTDTVLAFHCGNRSLLQRRDRG